MPDEVACSGIWRLVQSGEGGPRRIRLVHVDEAEALRDGQRDDLAGRLGRALEQRPHTPGERVVILRRGGWNGGVADHVAARGGVALHEAVRLERCEQPPGRAAVDAAALRELQRTARRGRRRHRLEQPQRAIDRLHARGGGVSTCGCAFRAHGSHYERDGTGARRSGSATIHTRHRP